MNKTSVGIVNLSPYPAPSYATPGSSGVDLRANIAGEIVINPREITAIPTGIFIEMPEGIEAQIRSRSGMTLKHGIVVANGIGTIDSDYRGEISVIITNISNEPYTVSPGEKIAQMVFCEYVKAEFNAKETLDDTERGAGGFGHTGNR
ncbi:MAG: dUTP diphosphatase [Eubacteriaceae bacterium]|nr:dUTP diphosphatase [Eubacteriaceae bacterium]